MDSPISDTEGQKTPLLEETRSKDAEEKQYPSIGRQRVMLCTVLLLQFCSLCADTIIYPFFPLVAKDKRLTSTHIGIVFTSFDLSRFLFSPIFGSVVSTQMFDSC